MASIQEQLPGLFALAHDRSEEGRIQLAGHLADLFMDRDLVLTETEEGQINELIDELLKRSSAELQIGLNRKFGDVTHMPRLLAVKLAFETSDLGSEVLLKSQVLTDLDLITVVERRGRDSARIVAKRESISAAVCDALVLTGDLQVMQSVAENLGAALSPKAVVVLVEAARLSQSLHQPLVQRQELTQESATKLYWWLAQDLRRYALERFHMPTVALEGALDQAVEDKLNAHALEKNDDAKMAVVADWLQDRGVLTSKILPQLLRQRHYRLFNIVLSRLTKMKLPLIDAVVDEAGGRTLAAVCRAIGIDKANFVSIFLLSRAARPGEQIVHPRELSFALAAFDRLTPSVAHDMIESWNLNPAYLLHRNEDDARETTSR